MDTDEIERSILNIISDNDLSSLERGDKNGSEDGTNSSSDASVYVPKPLIRHISGNISDQGSTNACWVYSCTRVIYQLYRKNTSLLYKISSKPIVYGENGLPIYSNFYSLQYFMINLDKLDTIKATDIYEYNRIIVFMFWVRYLVAIKAWVYIRDTSTDVGSLIINNYMYNPLFSTNARDYSAMMKNAMSTFSNDSFLFTMEDFSLGRNILYTNMVRDIFSSSIEPIPELVHHFNEALKVIKRVHDKFQKNNLYPTVKHFGSTASIDKIINYIEKTLKVVFIWLLQLINYLIYHIQCLKNFMVHMP